MLAETVCHPGFGDEDIESYYARPLGPGPFPGVVLIHHAPGWDEWCKEAARKLAYHGYATILPHLYSREGDGSPEDKAASARASGGVSDEQMLGDVQGCIRYLRAQPYSNGKVGVMGFCSGGRQTYLSACRIPSLDAAVDCWGGRVVATSDQLTDKQPVAPIDYTADLQVPLLGLFGNEDKAPSPEDVNKTEAALKQDGKTYEFHRYDGAGHGFFAADRPGYRPEQATDGWQKVFAWFDKYLH
jgi:carboxymethylenebutenolidase